MVPSFWSMPEPAFNILSLLRDPGLEAACGQWLREEDYRLEPIEPVADPLAILERRPDSFDAVLLEQGGLSTETRQALVERGLLLPAVVIGEVTGRVELHEAEVHLAPDQLEQLSYRLDAAVSRFLRRWPPGPHAEPNPASSCATPSPGPAAEIGAGSSPSASYPNLDPGQAAKGNGQGSGQEGGERWKLTNRLRGRLSYLGVYYKRDPERFLRNLPSADREELLRSLTRSYRDLLMSYFRDPASANQALESFVNTAFFSDLPITNTVEIHMNLIDSFGKQLQLEGHNNDFLQDYRLALLDVMAHLCEMYRRAVPPDPPLAIEPAALIERSA